MIKFLLKNKIQFITVVFTNLVLYMFVLYIIATRLFNISGLLSIILGILLVSEYVIMIKKVDKLSRPRVTVFYVLLIVVVSTLIINFDNTPEITLKGLGLFVGFMLWIIVWNVADTIDNIKEKSRLSLQDLDTK